MEKIHVSDKDFVLSIKEEVILKEVDRVANEINRDFAGKDPLFISLLNGSFMFTADLMKRINFSCEVQFVKFSSYEGTCSTGKVNEMSYDEFVKRFPGIKGDGKSVVVVDIGADWCKYCKELEPVMDELARKYKGRVQFYRIDSEKYPQIGSLLGISGIPHVLIFPKNGAPAQYGGFPRGNAVEIFSERIEEQM